MLENKCNHQTSEIMDIQCSLLMVLGIVSLLNLPKTFGERVDILVELAEHMLDDPFQGTGGRRNQFSCDAEFLKNLFGLFSAIFCAAVTSNALGQKSGKPVRFGGFNAIFLTERSFVIG